MGLAQEEGLELGLHRLHPLPGSGLDEPVPRGEGRDLEKWGGSCRSHQRPEKTDPLLEVHIARKPNVCSSLIKTCW